MVRTELYVVCRVVVSQHQNANTDFQPGHVVQPQASVDNAEWIKTLFDQMRHLTTMVHSINQRMQCVDSIDSKLTMIDNKLTSLDITMIETTLRVDKLEACVRETASENKKLKQQVRELTEQSTDDRDRLSRDVEDVFYDIDSIYQEQRDLKESVIDLKTRSMRDNLLFHGIPEMPGEEPKEVIKGFLKKEMKCDTDNVHRISPHLSNRPRTIVAKFANPDERREILTNTRQLRETQFGVSEQFPQEIVQRRRDLLPLFKEARRRGLKSNLTVDRLYIDGRRVYPGDDPFIDLTPRGPPPSRRSYASAVGRSDNRQPNKMARTEDTGENRPR
ncbi:uncharacterized protein LOC124115361 [Haliotis rufescens]|uniref:uncharacterized protein LOC124115361 n=1 Tax=Haliotis rufescens TaxID=6454 RepID=UPI00201F5D4A|nr:uncharacterized protein LOC124115361 [Haliotis rufescens]